MIQRPDIFQFKSYRSFLKAEMDFQRHADRKYSLIYFSAKIGHSGSYLKLVLSGKRALSLDAAAVLGKLLRLNSGERAYLIQLVIAESAASPALKAYVANQLTTLKNERLEYHPTQKLASIFQNSLVWEIFSLIGVEHFQPDPKWILPRLNRRQKSTAQVEAALAQLEKLGAIETQDSKTKAKNVVLKHGFDVTKIYTVALQRALEQLASFPNDPSAYFDAFCLILSEQEYEQIKAILEEAKAKAGKVAANRGAPKTRIAYFNSSLFWASSRLS